MTDRDNVVPLEGSHGPARHLRNGDMGPHGGGGGGGMESDFKERLAKLEGVSVGYKFALSAVSAVLIGGIAILVTMMLAVQGDVARLRDDVNALPGNINQNLLELNRTLSESITAARSNYDAPQIIVIERETGTGSGDQ